MPTYENRKSFKYLLNKWHQICSTLTYAKISAFLVHIFFYVFPKNIYLRHFKFQYNQQSWRQYQERVPTTRFISAILNSLYHLLLLCFNIILYQWNYNYNFKEQSFYKNQSILFESGYSSISCDFEHQHS